MPRLGTIRLKSGEAWFTADQRANSFVLRWSRAATAVLRADGRLQAFRAERDAAPISLRVLRHLLYAYRASLRGQESLHATALQAPLGGPVVAFLGRSGAGKSTLARHLLRRCWSLFTDDVLYLDPRNPRRIRPRSSWLKFRDPAEVRWQGRPLTFDPNLEKYVLPVHNHLRSWPRLGGLFLLLRGGPKQPITIEPVRGRDAVVKLLPHVYNELLRPPAVLRRQFEWISAVAAVIPVWCLRYPTGLNRLSEVARSLERFVETRR